MAIRTGDAPTAGGTTIFLRVVLPFLVTLVCLFTLAVASMAILSSLRAYAGGEGLYSKGQMQAVYHLNRYAASKDPAEFQRYLRSISVPLGDQKARIELEKPEPDYDVAKEGFLQGRNDPADIPGLINIFRRFRRMEYVDLSVAIWAAADAHINRLTALGDRLRDEIEKGGAAQHRIDAVLAEIDREAVALAPLEDAFSYTLGKASRQVRKALVVILAIVTAFLTTFVALFARSVLREREEHQQALGESEERYRSFFETGIDAVLLCGPDGTIEAVNPAARLAFGYSESDMMEPRGDGIDRETYESIRTALEKASQSGRYRGNLEFRRRDGRTFVGEVSASRFTDFSGRPKTSVIIRDISARIRAEEEIRRLNASLEERVASRTIELESANRELVLANRELESFCYSVSHDLRLPLRSMNGFSELLISDYGGKLDDRARSYLDRIEVACRRMGRLIDDLLSLTRYTRQKMVLERVDLGGIAADVVEELRAEHPERTVEVTIDADLVATTEGDGTLLRVLLRSLLSNAWKFSVSRDPARIEVGSYMDGPERVYFVRDNGCGFDMAYADKLFRIFNRLHTAEEFEGTGIGLATVQRVVMRHGGRVWAEGAPDRGATFYFTLHPEILVNGKDGSVGRAGAGQAMDVEEAMDAGQSTDEPAREAAT